MAKKRGIKLIKATEKDVTYPRGHPGTSGSSNLPENRDSSRAMIRTISGWIRESQRKREAVSSLRLRNLFEDLVPRPHEG